jgi:hypothetical protein
MAIGSEQRRAVRRPIVAAAFPSDHVDPALDLLHLVDMAWHDCYGPSELEIPERILDDVLLLADGDLARLIQVARAAVIDFRDVRVAADAEREQRS